MKLVKLFDLFNIKYGGKFSTLSDFLHGKTPVIKSSDSKNGVFAYLNINPNYQNVITIARTGSVGSTFYHPVACYITDDCMVLKPRFNFDEELMLCYASLIRLESFKYNYSRKVTPKRLGNSLIPEPKEVRKFLPKSRIKQPTKQPHHYNKVSLTDREWDWFMYDALFDIQKGFYNKKPIEKKKTKEIPLIGATENNNGVTSYYSIETISETKRDGNRELTSDIKKKIYKKNCITFSNGGSIGNVFFQPKDFSCAHHINPIYLIGKELNVYIGMFISTLMKLEKYRYSSCGRECRNERLKGSKIKLPITQSGNPNWEFMEDYIKSLPYSSNLSESIQKNDTSHASERARTSRI